MHADCVAAWPVAMLRGAGAAEAEAEAEAEATLSLHQSSTNTAWYYIGTGGLTSKWPIFDRRHKTRQLPRGDSSQLTGRQNANLATTSAKRDHFGRSRRNQFACIGVHLFEFAVKVFAEPAVKVSAEPNVYTCPCPSPSSRTCGMGLHLCAQPHAANPRRSNPADACRPPAGLDPRHRPAHNHRPTGHAADV